MAEMSLPPGAFAAARSGAPAPTEAASTSEPVEKVEPAVIVRKAQLEKKAEPVEAKEEAPTPAERKIWKLKADSEEFDFDATDEEAVKREIMKARGADKRFKEAAAMRQQSEQFLSMLKDPAQLKKVLTDPRIGVDLKKFAEDYVWEQMEEAQLSPEEKDRRARDRELEELRAERDKGRQTKAEQERALRQSRHEETYEKTILSALEKQGVPRDQITVMKMADYMIAAVQKGYDLNPEEIADLVKNDTTSYLKSYAKALNEDQLLDFLGDEIADKIRKADLKKLKSPTSNPFQPKLPRKESQEPSRPQKMKGHEWREDIIAGFLARK